MNLHEGQVSSSALISDRDNMVVDEMWNKKVFPLLLRINGYTDLAHDEIPVWEHGDVQPLSLEEESKAFQRMQNFLPIIPATINKALKVNRIDFEFDENTTYEELMAVMPPQLSKGGQDNGGTSGTGVNGAQSEDPGSEMNSDNAA